MRPARALAPLLLLGLALGAARTALVEPDAARPAPPSAGSARPAAAVAAAVVAPSPPPAVVAPSPPAAIASAAAAGPPRPAERPSAGAGEDPPVRPADTRTAVVLGTVRWPDGSPAGEVSILASCIPTAHVIGPRTDAGGWFRVPVPPGRFVLEARSADRTAAATAQVEVEAGGTQAVDLVLTRLVPVSVWLVGPHGERRRAGWVQARSLDAPDLGWAQGHDGELRAWPGRSRIVALHPDGEARADVEVQVGTAPAEVVLPVAAEGRLAGVVLGPDGAPAANIAVVARRPPRGWQDTGRGWEARTDAAGRFTLEALPADDLRLEGRSHERMWLGQLQVTVTAERSPEVSLSLEPRATLRGRLVVPGARGVMVPLDLRARDGPERARPLHTDPHDGSFACPWLPDGTYVVSVPDDWLPELARELGLPRVVVAPVEVTISGARAAEVELQVVLP